MHVQIVSSVNVVFRPACKGVVSWARMSWELLATLRKELPL